MTGSGLLIFAALLVVALVLEPAARRAHLPFYAVLVVTGFLGSELIVGLGLDTGLRWYHFHRFLLHVFLPVLVFEAAYKIRLDTLREELAPILFLAVPVLLIAALLSAVVLYWGIAHPRGFPFITALIAGALLSATDPVAVIALCEKAGMPGRLGTLMEGESLINDATTIVLFGVLLGFSAAPTQGGDIPSAIMQFVWVFFGGIVCGAVVGGLAWLVRRITLNAITRALTTLIGALFAFSAAEFTLEVSGVMAVMCTGLILGETSRREARADISAEVWALGAYIANALIFLLMGATVTTAMFSERWLAMLIGIGAVSLSRALSVYVLLPSLNPLPGVAPTGWREATLLYWGGLRGAVTIALALALPLTLEGWWTVQSIAYGVVLFTLFVQAPSLGALLGRLKIK